MKIPLPELGLDCKKKPLKDKAYTCKQECVDIGFNQRTAENEKSVLFIDKEELARKLMYSDTNLYDISTAELLPRYREMAKRLLSQNPKSFMRIEKE